MSSVGLQTVWHFLVVQMHCQIIYEAKMHGNEATTLCWPTAVRQRPRPLNLAKQICGFFQKCVLHMSQEYEKMLFTIVPLFVLL